MPWNEVETGGVWKPTVVGDKLEGVVRSRKTIMGKNNQEYTQFTIEKAESGEEVKMSGAVLESKLGEIPDGTRVLLTYKGKPKGTYLDYSVMAWEDEKPAL